MACFIVPAAEAVATTIIEKSVRAKQQHDAQCACEMSAVCNEDIAVVEENTTKVSFSRKLRWLNTMLWGGSALLAFEHVWHGEVVPYFPFLSAASNPIDAAAMLHEMSTTGVVMALSVTAVWGCAVAITSIIEKRPIDKAAEALNKAETANVKNAR